METRSRALAGAAELVFGFTGLGRLYLNSYSVGLLKLAITLSLVVLWSLVPSDEAKSFDISVKRRTQAIGFLTLILVAITTSDLVRFAQNAITTSPEPLYSDTYVWAPSQGDATTSTYIGYAIAFAVPFGLVSWLYGVS